MLNNKKQISETLAHALANEYKNSRLPKDKIINSHPYLNDNRLEEIIRITFLLFLLASIILLIIITFLYAYQQMF